MILALFLVNTLQKSLNDSRDRLGFKHTDDLLEGAPPVLQFTTVALGGFRGLIANALWLRMNQLQEDGKYFEMVQLADWITKLQPRFTSVWVFQAWNMAYNISVKCSDHNDRWHWVKSGIELIRDQGLRYNPKETLLYRELGWLFQHKMGQNLDDANRLYKSAWAGEMQAVLGDSFPLDYAPLLNPQTEEEKAKLTALREVYKMDPKFMQEVDNEYGPLEWRLPESHAIYWASRGLKMAKIDDLMPLRREIYQPMQTAFKRGRLLNTQTDEFLLYGPNLDIIPNVSKSYENMLAKEPENAKNISTAHKNFLLDAVGQLYLHQRMGEAERWYQVLKTKYFEKFKDLAERYAPEYDPAELPLDDFAIPRINEMISDNASEGMSSVIQALLQSSYQHLALGADAMADNFYRMAKKSYGRFEEKSQFDEATVGRIGFGSFEKLNEEVLNTMLNPQFFGMEMVRRLATALEIPKEELEQIIESWAQPQEGPSLPAPSK